MTKANALTTALLERAGVTKDATGFKESFEVTKPAMMSGFRGMFGEFTLSSQEEERIAAILQEHLVAQEEAEKAEDCKTLFRLTSEIKAISNQSIVLHGERIKKAQEILKSYKEGAFTAWLFATYGNRQTPYSMLQYFELYSLLSPKEKVLIEKLPKKAAYTLAAREGPFEAKIEFLRGYKGERQKEVLLMMREAFPKERSDKRVRSVASTLLDDLEKVVRMFEERHQTLSGGDYKRFSRLCKRLSLLKATFRG